MGRERRSATRERALITAWWGTEGRSQQGVIRDLSLEGCFVSTKESAEMGKSVWVEVGLPSVAHMQISGTVVRVERGVGFAVRFRRCTATERTVLTSIIKRLGKKPVTS